MNTKFELKLPARLGPQNWFRARRRRHDPMLVLNMSIFNSGHSWNRFFNPISQRENVWC